MAILNQAWIDVLSEPHVEDDDIFIDLNGIEKEQEQDDTSKKRKRRFGCLAKLFSDRPGKKGTRNDEPEYKVHDYAAELEKINKENAKYKQGDQDSYSSISTDTDDDGNKSYCCCFGLLASWISKKMEQRREKKIRKKMAKYEVQELTKEVRFDKFIVVTPPPANTADDIRETETCSDAEEIDGVEVISL